MIEGIHQQPPLEIVADIGEPLIVEAIREERHLPILHPHVLTQVSDLGISIVEKIVAIDEERIALLHAYMAKGLQGVGRLEEIGTIAIHVGTVVTEDHLPHEHLRLRIHLLIERERVGMFQKDLCFRRLQGISRHYNGRVCLLCAQHERQQTADHSY